MITGEHTFKLLAIRPLNGCGQKYIRSLIPDELYKFYNYEFTPEKGPVIEITAPSNFPDSLYASKPTSIPLSLSAVVGKNGSGKSTLMELLYAAIYVLSVEKDYLEGSDGIKKGKEYQQLLEELKVEIYFLYDDTIQCLRLEGDLLIKYVSYANPKDDLNTIRHKKLFTLLTEPSEFNIEDFFYSIAINYSLYGLNSKHIGDWIKNLFHKNDGYKTPIVINPMRTDGNININKEESLAKQRLLSNVVRVYADKTKTHHQVTDNQVIKAVIFKLNQEKVENVITFNNETGEKKSVPFNSFYSHNNGLEVILGEIYNKLFGKEYTSASYNHISIKKIVEKYIIKKIVKIARTYPYYKNWFKDGPDRLPDYNPNPTGSSYRMYQYYFTDLANYIEVLSDDHSHITFKLWRAVNFLKHDILKDGDGVEYEFSNESNTGKQKIKSIRITIDELSDRIYKLDKEQVNIDELIPPSIFDIDFELERIEEQKNTDNEQLESRSYFSQLSSGEQQLIHSVQSVLYHLNNLNSIYNKPAEQERNKYRFVNLIFDEVELYFHPEYQRQFIHTLIGSIERATITNIKAINVLFLTHSPFILSDIFHQNVLKLKYKHKPELANKYTLGANIYDLLADEFFMESATGKYIEGKINKLLSVYNKIRSSESEKEILQNENEFMRIEPEFEFISKYIGEDVIREVLKNHFSFIKETLNGKSETE